VPGVFGAVAVAVTFGWLGMVVAISFLEAPLKFRAPGVTLAVGLGIGRLVFRALNVCEVVLATVLAVAIVGQRPPGAVLAAGAVAVLTLLAQLVVVRPALSRRTVAVLAGHEGPRSNAHWFYVGLELVKVAALLVTGVLLLA
jgi:hypothetical protein